ncbi:MAG TPA: acetate--CoA ligase family protein [Mycobacteriales bacterium]|jgi:acyl-CoA synthetase (NDP forming)|nr:acetate--CoA ligase family protein [Mycobacteriales bacterium]
MDRKNLERLLAPKTIAVFGANTALGMSNNAILPMLEAGIDVRMVNPRRDTVYDRPAADDLTALGEPMDAVLCLVNAARSVDVVREAAATGCGGVVLAAGGFAEAGPDGVALQAEVTAIAAESGLAVVGPNCSGFRNVPLQVNLFTGGRLALQPGGVCVVSQSGFLVRAALAAAAQRQLGVGVAVSSGNEAVCDLADYVEFLADDPATTVICLVVEKLRQPERFFAAVRTARERGVPVIALKLGRSASSRAILQSHTGAIADESWVYELAFAEHGVLSARDIDDLLDQAQLFAQLPRQQWRPMRNVGVITSSGGVAALATDLAEPTAVRLPALHELRDWVTEQIPGAATLNPLDMTGFVMTNPEILRELFRRYATAAELDAVLLCWWLGDEDAAWARLLLEPYATAAGAAPLLVSPVEGTALGDWVPQLREGGVYALRGVAATYRAMEAMTRFVTAELAPARGPVAVGDAAPPVTTAAGLVPFAAAMELLRDCGITPAPYRVLDPSEDALPAEHGLGERLVVKLADVAHRTELAAVVVGVTAAEVPAAVQRLRQIAREHGEPETVVVQQLIIGHGEAFAGIAPRTDLGPFVLFGRGGVQVETGGGVTGRGLPLDRARAAALVDEVAGPAVFARLRGEASWDPEPLIATLLGVSELWQRVGGWARSVDINPLIVAEDGIYAVDALLLAESDGDI